MIPSIIISNNGGIKMEKARRRDPLEPTRDFLQMSKEGKKFFGFDDGEDMEQEVEVGVEEDETDTSD